MNPRRLYNPGQGLEWWILPAFACMAAFLTLVLLFALLRELLISGWEWLVGRPHLPSPISDLRAPPARHEP